MCRTSGNNEVCSENLEQALAECPETYGHLDLVCFGFPCQDISIGNPNGKGLKGERSSIFFECMRIVRLLQPKWLLIENVPRLLSINGGRDMAVVLQMLAECGYGWAYRVLDSRYFGVPQRRRRVFIIGCFGAVPPPEVLYEPKGNQRDVPQNDEASSVSHCVNARSGVRQDSSVDTFIAKTINTGQRGNNYAWRENYVASTITQNTGIHNARNDTLIAKTQRSQRDSGKNAAWDDIIARAVNTGQRSGSGATQETYLAQPYAFGEGEASGVSRRLDTPRGCVIGNSVTVPVAEWIGKRIMKYNQKVKTA
jgi:DNA-cytosine methyltransferase